MNLKTSLFLLAGITAVSSFSFDAEAKRKKQQEPTPTEPAPTDPDPEPTEPTEPGCVGTNVFEHDFVGWGGASWGQSGLELDSCEAVVVADLLESNASNLDICDYLQATVPGADSVSCDWWDGALNVLDPVRLSQYSPDSEVYVIFAVDGLSANNYASTSYEASWYPAN